MEPWHNNNARKRCRIGSRAGSSSSASASKEDTGSPIVIWTDIDNFKDEVHKFTGMSSSSGSFKDDDNLDHSGTSGTQQKQHKQSSSTNGNSIVLKPTPKKVSTLHPTHSDSASGWSQQNPPLFGGGPSSADAAESDSFVKADSFSGATVPADSSDVLSWISNLSRFVVPPDDDVFTSYVKKGLPWPPRLNINK